MKQACWNGRRGRKPSTKMRATVAALALLMGCNNSDLPSATEPQTGAGLVYTLVSVENKAVPATVSIGADASAAVLSGKLTLSPDSTWIVSHVIAASTTVGAARSLVTLRGTYNRAGSALTLKQQAAGTTAFTGTYSDNAVQLAAVAASTPGTSFAYTR